MDTAGNKVPGLERDPELGRDLIEEFEDCSWRETKLEILKELCHYPQPRIIEFLIHCGSQDLDLPLAEAAIGSLGRSKSPLAARFLLHFLDECAQSLQPAVVSALGQIRFSPAGPALLLLFQSAQKQKLSLLSRNCLLALAELKIPETVNLLESACIETKLSQSPFWDPQSQISEIGRAHV